LYGLAILLTMKLHDNIFEVINGKVEGNAFIPLKNGYTVSCGVFSYEYNGDKINHIPSSTLTDKQGKIIYESEIHDTNNANKAIKRAKESCIWLAENYDQFIE